MKFPTGKTKNSKTINMFEQHLAHSIDELWKALDIKEIHYHDDFLIQWRLSCSCILHSFYAVDSLINYLAYEYFENNKSGWYIEPDDRKSVTENQLKGWHRLSFDSRIKIIWEEQEFPSIPQTINNKILELRNLRNWVAHGNPYTVIIEHEFIQIDDETVKGIIHDTYPDPNKKGFESEEFRSPAYLTKDDAKKAVQFALEIIIFILSQAKGFHGIIKTFHGGKKEFWIDGDTSINQVLSELKIDD